MYNTRESNSVKNVSPVSSVSSVTRAATYLVPSGLGYSEVVLDKSDSVRMTSLKDLLGEGLDLVDGVLVVPQLLLELLQRRTRVGNVGIFSIYCAYIQYPLRLYSVYSRYLPRVFQ